MSMRLHEGSSSANQTVTRRKSFRRRRNTTKKTLAQVPTKNQVRQLVNRSIRENIEHKVYYKLLAYSTLTAFYPNTTGRIEDLSDIPTAVGVNARVGINVMPTSIELRWMIFAPDSTAQSAVYNLRAILCIMNINSVDVTPGTVVFDTTANSSLITPYANTTRTVRKILWDYQVNLFHYPVQGGSGSVSVATTENQAVGKIYIPLNTLKPKWRPITFDASPGTTGENHIFLLTFSNLSAQAGSWTSYFYSTLNYTDA